MKLTCLNCGHEFEGSISLDNLGWHSVCPECGSSFDVDVPEGRIVMAFTDPVEHFDENGEYVNSTYEFLTDEFSGEGIHTYYAFNTPEEFIDKWEEILDEPNGMWYWVLDNGKCICSGACDPGDLEDIFLEHFENNELPVRYQKKTYYVTYKIDARYVVEVEAKNLEEAMEEAESMYYDADFGEAEDIDGNPIIVEDEKGNFVWEQ